MVALIKASIRFNSGGDGGGGEGAGDGGEGVMVEEKDESLWIVHCSASVGWSRTFITLDYLLTELEDGTFDPVDITSAIKTSLFHEDKNTSKDISTINAGSFNFNKTY